MFPEDNVVSPELRRPHDSTITNAVMIAIFQKNKEKGTFTKRYYIVKVFRDYSIHTTISYSSYSTSPLFQTVLGSPFQF